MNSSDAVHQHFYRNNLSIRDLVSFSLVVGETDLFIFAEAPLSEEAHASVLSCRSQLERYMQSRPAFRSSLEPLPLDSTAPPIVQEMLHAAQCAQVGPMAAVVGAIAESVGKDLLTHSPQVLVENGGDIFLNVTKKITVGVYAGNSSLSSKVGLRIDPESTPLGVCTSSGTVGHSLSFGRSDAVTVVSRSTALADATATAIGNLVKDKSDIEQGLAQAQRIKDIHGIVIIIDDQLGVWGNIEVVTLP